jgi:cyclase
MSLRIIPRLDIKGPNLVKGIHMEGLRVLGRPEDFARYYYENGADELIYMDAVASLYGRNSLLDIVERTTRNIFIPLTVGGGLRTVEDIRAVLRAGADKVSLNTAAIKRPELIREASQAFGSSTIIVSIEALKKSNGCYEAYVDFGRERTGVDALEWAMQAAELGAGELMVTSINQEGTGLGYDIALTSQIAQTVSIPVIASGGAGEVAHIFEVVQAGKADAVSMASILHYNVVRNQPFNIEQYREEGNIDFLSGKQGERRFSRFRDISLPEIKQYLIERAIDTRPAMVVK